MAMDAKSKVTTRLEVGIQRDVLSGGKYAVIDVESIARVCHEVNKAYCESLDDYSQPDWSEAPAWAKDSAVQGVIMHLNNPEAGPEASHESWLAQKRREGWKYGEKKDPEKKEHPCFVPYNELPREQQTKDFLFRAVVHALN